MNHQPVRTTLQLYIASLQHKCPKSTRSDFNTAKLKHQHYQDWFRSDLDDRLMLPAPLTGNITEKWTQCKQMVMDLEQWTVGPKKGHTMTHLMKKMKKSVRYRMKRIKHILIGRITLFSVSKKDCYRCLWSKFREIFIRCRISHSAQMVFSTIKSVYGPSKPNTTPLLSDDGITLSKIWQLLILQQPLQLSLNSGWGSHWLHTSATNLRGPWSFSYHQEDHQPDECRKGSSEGWDSSWNPLSSRTSKK